MRRRAVVTAGAVAALAVAAVLSGCSAGQITQTSSQVAAVPGSSTNIGPIAIRNALVPYDGITGYLAGGNAPLTVRIFNNGPTTVKLVGVSSDDATSVTLEGGATAAAPKPTPTPTATAASPSPTGSGSPAPGASGSPAAGATSPSPTASVGAGTATGPTTFSIAIAPLGYALLVPGQGEFLQLTGLKRALVPGSSVKVTFTFDDGSKATLDLPVGAATVPVPRATPEAPVKAEE